ncbi:MAG: FKBP-type peptidyl-prolyl cis-trans isomerase [Candidatus Thiodiazotropha sp.]|jgi:FKBP-type peptidyl-prolyl cis-trans isomerase FklB
MKLKIFALSAITLCISQISYGAELETQNERYSYAVGLQVGQLLKQQQINTIDTGAFSLAIKDYLENRDPKLSQEDMHAAMKKHQEEVTQARAETAKANLKKGEAFRAQHAKEEGVTVLENGMQYTVQKAGEGELPKAEDKVSVHYKGTLIDGTEFDSSHKRGKPAEFKLSGVVPGFREAITRMKPGAKWQVVIPPELAYGENGAGNRIGPNETLIFDIEYLGLATAEAEKATVKAAK